MQIHGISMHIWMLYKCIYIKLLISVDFFRNPQALDLYCTLLNLPELK